jgi:hypothetical protein
MPNAKPWTSRVVAVLAHVPEDVRVDLAGAEDLDPRLAAADRAARAVAQEAVLAVEAGDVDLDARLGEREEVRAQADLALVAEDRAGEGQQRALQVGERDVLVDREPLDLVELRRVGRVGVAAVDPARDDDVERRRRGHHRARLHRRGVRAQDDVGAHVERVRPLARGVRRRVVERVEVVEDVVDLGALLDVEAQAEEDVLDLAPHGREQVQPADGLGRRAGQRDVDAVGREARVELGRLELRDAVVDEGLERFARLVGGAADLAALGRLELRDAAQDVRQLGLAAEEADAELLEAAVSLAPSIAACASSRSWVMRSRVSVMERKRAPQRAPAESPIGSALRRRSPAGRRTESEGTGARTHRSIH